MPIVSPHSLPLAPDFSRPVHCILGLPFDDITLQGAVAKVQYAVQTRSPLFISTPNLNFLIASQTDAEFRQSVINSDLSLADGMPIIWIAKLLGIPIKERVAGSTLFEALRSAPVAPGNGPLKVFFFGGPEGVAQAAARRLNADQASTPAKAAMQCVGFESPGFGSIADMSTPELIARINAAHADFLVVALGASKGQAWIEFNRAHLNVPVVSHLGAVVNFVAGTVKRAPRWAQRFGFEWAWRIKEEPTLWRRYWTDGQDLLKLMTVQILPLAWHTRALAPTHAALQGARVRVAEAHGGLVIELTGAWSVFNVAALHGPLVAHVSEARLLTIDLTHVTFADSTIAGALIQACGYRVCKGLPVVCRAPTSGPARYMVQSVVKTV